jgi:Alginate export
MKKIILVIILTALFFTGKAQLKIDAEYRPRFEFRDGYSTLKTDDSDPAYFVTQRTRLNLTHTYNNLTSKISIQDIRIWGDSKLKADVAGVNFSEAYFKLKLSNYWDVSVGRQSINVDNKRLFSAANWNQISASHDGITLDYLNESFNFKMITAFNQALVSNFGTDYYALIGNYKFLNLIYLEKKLGNFSLANLTITDGYQKDSTNTDYYRFTTGGIIKYKNNASDIQFRGFYQTGKNKIGQDVNAYYLSGSYAHKFESVLKLTGGFEYMSGNDLTDETNKTDNAFDILYGARHWFNGMMDYFSIPKTTKNAGLVNGYLKIDFTKIENWKISTHYHYLALANNYIYEGEKQDKFLANEIDLIATWKMNDIINLQMGYGMLFGEKTLEYVKGIEGDGLQQYFFTMITVKPTFFKN